MTNTIGLSMREVTDVLEAVFAYNGRTARHFAFLASDGSRVVFERLEVECDDPGGLVVRVAPETAVAPEDYIHRLAINELAASSGKFS